MAKFHVILQPEAELNIAAIHRWIADRSPDGADRWYLALEQAIECLGMQPERFPVAPESRQFDCEVRDLLFKTRRGLPYRLLFGMQESEVHVLYVRGPGQDWVTRKN